MFPQTFRLRGNSGNKPNSSLPEVTVGVDDPHSKALDPGLFGSNTLVTAKHAQGELVHPRLQHGAKLPLEVGGLVLWGVVVSTFTLPVDVQQAIRVSRIVIVVSLDQGEERLGHLTPLLALWGWGARGACPLGRSFPS